MSKITSLRTEGLPVERSEAIRLIEEIASLLHCVSLLAMTALIFGRHL